MRKASALLQEAGFVIKSGKRVMPNGEPMTIEFLIDEPSLPAASHAVFIKNLGTARHRRHLAHRRSRCSIASGSTTSISISRCSVSRFPSTPGDSLRSYFSSQAAALKGSQNLAGIADPVIDALIERIIAAQDRPALVTACKVLDRVIRAGRYWIPHWYKASHWVAYWDVFGRPAAKPRYARGIPETWWHDRDKAAKIEREG